MKLFAAIALLALLPSLDQAHAAAGPEKGAAPAPLESDWRTPDPQNVLVIDTNRGRVLVEMEPAAAPATVERIRVLARQGFYDGRAFFRVIDGFMDQTGDPKDNGTGGSALPNLPPEFTFRRSSDLPFAVAASAGGVERGFIGALPVISQSMDLGSFTKDGRVAAYVTFCDGVGGFARADAPDSGNSQFFLMRSTRATLDNKYTGWGRVISGLDVVRSIKTGEPPPPPADKMTKVRLLADMPAAERPNIRVIDTRGAWFKAALDRAAVGKSAELSLCDIDLPSQIK